jgi:beta-lactamase class A
MSKTTRAISEVPGVVGVAARHLETGEEVRHRAGDVFFTASTLKVPLLVELYRQVDQGAIDPDQSLELTDALRAPGSGVLKEMASGLTPTVHDLALLMIIISDNTATDMLYDLVGRDALDETMRRLGLGSTRIPMSCRELLYSIFDVETDDVVQGNAVADARRARGEVAEGASAFSEARSDVSSPADMVRLLGLVHRGDVLSSTSREAVLDILGRQQLNTIIPYDLPAGTRVLHKTGGVPTVRCDVGIVHAPSGPYAVALMAKQVTDMKAVDRALARVSRAIYDELGG